MVSPRPPTAASTCHDTVTVLIPEFVVTRWWEQIFHNQSALLLKGRLLFRKGTVVTSVPYHVDREAPGAGRPCPSAATYHGSG